MLEAHLPGGSITFCFFSSGNLSNPSRCVAPGFPCGSFAVDKVIHALTLREGFETSSACFRITDEGSQVVVRLKKSPDLYTGLWMSFFKSSLCCEKLGGIFLSLPLCQFYVLATVTVVSLAPSSHGRSPCVCFPRWVHHACDSVPTAEWDDPPRHTCRGAEWEVWAWTHTAGLTGGDCPPPGTRVLQACVSQKPP